MKDTIIGVDLAKNTFFLVVLNKLSNRMQRKKFSRNRLKTFMAKQVPSLVAMEACSSSHYWARLFRSMGHEVLLLPAQHVKAFLRGQKNDYNDAQATAEAAQQGNIRPVTVKSVTQQDEQALLRMRTQLTNDKTRLVNQVRGLLAEYGIIMPNRVHEFRQKIPLILEDAENGLTPKFRALLHRQYQRFLGLEDEILWYDQQIHVHAKTDETCIRLRELPGFGPVVSSAFKAWIGDGKQFKKGRDASAALGVVPRQHSTGGKPLLLGITKRGDRYLRSLIVHGARAVVRHAKHKQDKLSLWVNRLVEKRGANKAIVALANKLIRIAWVIVARGERYKPAVA